MTQGKNTVKNMVVEQVIDEDPYGSVSWAPGSRPGSSFLKMLIQFNADLGNTGHGAQNFSHS